MARQHRRKSILGGERLDLGAEFFDPTRQQLGSRRTTKPVAYGGDPQGAISIKKNFRGTDLDFGFVSRPLLIG
ncbi:hypothetical protein [Acidicapsa acidisoli]|uniref:hypothetical protein n=1 Tax=Acidicapsa acidisoli TaxID=1615681 RepID=UPI0021E0274F|nr:hypothetical protein [Acidicapsa acidisoli]